METIFEVTRPIKGRAAETRTIVHSKASGGNCGVRFTPGSKYRVFAYRNSDQFTTGMCTWTRSIEPKALDNTVADETDREQITAERLRRRRLRAMSHYEFFVGDETMPEAEQWFYDDYVRLVERATKRDSTRYFFNGADELEDWRDYENFADAYVNAVELAPNSPVYRIGAGGAFLKLGQYAESLTHFGRALELDPKNSKARIGHAQTNLVLNNAIDSTVSDYKNLEADLIDLSGRGAGTMDLSGGTFGKLLLDNARINHLRLVRAKIYGGSFKNAHLRSARLDASTISSAVDLSFVDFLGASFIDGQFRNVSFSGSNFVKTDGQYGLFERADFSNTNLDRANFSRASMSGVDLTNARLGSVSFENADLGRSLLAGTDLRRVNLEGADISGAKINCETKLPSNGDVREAQLIPIEPICGQEPQNRDFSNKPWDYDDFSDLDLRNASFVEAHFNRTNFHNSQLQGANFSGAEGRARFSGSDLTGASFVAALVEATFHWKPARNDESKDIQTAILTNVDFTEAKLKTDMFLGYGFYFDPEIDVSEAVFEKAQMECKSELHISRIERYENRKDERRIWDDRNPEEKAYWEQRVEGDYDFALKWMAAEGAFVRGLKAKWPSMILSDQCQVYFAEGGRFSGGD